jgi:hypothetical protein
MLSISVQTKVELSRDFRLEPEAGGLCSESDSAGYKTPGPAMLPEFPTKSLHNCHVASLLGLNLKPQTQDLAFAIFRSIFRPLSRLCELKPTTIS